MAQYVTVHFGETFELFHLVASNHTAPHPKIPTISSIVNGNKRISPAHLFVCCDIQLNGREMKVCDMLCGWIANPGG